MDFAAPLVSSKRERDDPGTAQPEAFTDEHQRKRTKTVTRSSSSSTTLAVTLDTPLPLEKHERRRVNPEALALRLGPELVAELDTLITPGMIEMPCFAARREIQVRHDVDRRHIYDYYHAKGLRVLKEDKPGTSSQTKERPGNNDDPLNASNIRPIRALPPRRGIGQHGMPAPSLEVTSPHSIQKAPRSRRAPSHPLSNSQRSSDISLQSNTSLVTPHLDNFSYQVPTFHFPEFEDFRTQAHSLHHGPQETSFFEQGPADSGSMSTGLHFDYNSRPLLYNHKHEFSASLSRTSDQETESVSSQTLPTPPPLDLSDLLEPEFATGSPVPYMLPLDEESLSQKEREECYLFFSYALGPSSGLQESVGSYKTFMKVQTRQYFDKLKEPPRTSATPPVSVHPAHVPSPPASCSLFGERPPPTPEARAEDFKKWLMPPRRRGHGSPLINTPTQSVSEKIHTDDFDFLSTLSTPSPFMPETGMVGPPSLEDIFAADGGCVPDLPPPTLTAPEAFRTYPDADFHIRGIPIIAHDKFKYQQLPGVHPVPNHHAHAQQPLLAPAIFSEMTLPPPYFPQAHYPVHGPAMQDFRLNYPVPQYMAHQVLPGIMPGDENHPPHGMLGHLQASAAAVFTHDAPVFPPPLYAPAPSRPKLGWLGWEQGRSMSGRSRGISASGDL